MQEKLLSAEEVKKVLNVTDFRNITKDKLIEFVSAIPYIDKDVAVRIIEQFPEFSKCATQMVAQMNSVADSIIQENGKTGQEVMNGYKQTLAMLEILAQKDGISPKDRRFFAEKAIEVADKMAAYDVNNKSFLAALYKYGTCVVSGCIFLAALVLGVNLKGVKIPHVK